MAIDQSKLDKLKRTSRQAAILGFVFWVTASALTIGSFFLGWAYGGAAVIVFLWGALFLAISQRIDGKIEHITPQWWEVGDPDGRDD